MTVAVLLIFNPGKVLRPGRRRGAVSGGGGRSCWRDFGHPPRGRGHLHCRQGGSCVVWPKASAWVAKFGERGPGDEQAGVAWSWGVGAGCFPLLSIFLGAGDPHSQTVGPGSVPSERWSLSLGTERGPGDWAEDTEKTLPGLGGHPPEQPRYPGRRQLWPTWADPGWRVLCMWRWGHQHLLSRPPRLGAPLISGWRGGGPIKTGGVLRGGGQLQATCTGQRAPSVWALRQPGPQFLSE